MSRCTLLTVCPSATFNSIVCLCVLYNPQYCQPQCISVWMHSVIFTSSHSPFYRPIIHCYHLLAHFNLHLCPPLYKAETMAHLVFSCKYLNLRIISLLFCQFILPGAMDQSISIPCLKCASASHVITVPLSCRLFGLKRPPSKLKAIIRYDAYCCLSYYISYGFILFYFQQGHLGSWVFLFFKGRVRRSLVFTSQGNESFLSHAD